MLKEVYKYKGRNALDVSKELDMEIDDFLDDLFSTGYYCCPKCGEIVDVEQLGNDFNTPCNKCSENKWWVSTTGQIELQMTIEQANSTNHSGECKEDCITLLNSPNIKEQLDKYTPEIIKQVIDEYTDWDDSEWEEEIEKGELTIEDVYKLRLLWIASGDISDNED